jgi:hypothetical protein
MLSVNVSKQHTINSGRVSISEPVEYVLKFQIFNFLHFKFSEPQFLNDQKVSSLSSYGRGQ